MYGVVTRNAEEVEWPEFDRAFYEVKDVTGRAGAPISNAVNTISCFADNAAAADDPDLVPVSADGERATRDQPYFDWSHVCPTHEGYREQLLGAVDECTAENEDVRLDDVGFPRTEYCFCERCDRRFEESEFDDRSEWRESVVTGFVAEVRDRVPGRLYLALYPDPYPGHLSRRSGVDLAAMGEYVDEFVIPVYDMAYSTTYWLEILASGFSDALSTPFSVELYAVNVDVDNLIGAATVAGEYGEGVVFGYDASNARAALRRMKADGRNGVSHGGSS